jgi:cobaltochelatase CobS
MIASDTTTTPVDAQDLLKRFAGAIQDHLELKSTVDEDKVHEIVDEAVAAARLPRPLEIHLPDARVVKLEGHVHCQFQELIDLVEEGTQNILMVGPAGSGKTTLAKSAAKALDLDFGFISLSAGITETHLFGRVLPQADGTWGYVPSRFVQVYENGGVFLLDEIDAADSNVMVAVNAALANGVLANPVNGKVHVRHKDCIILAAANTWGRGGDQQYVGRNQLDAATLDRFVLSTVLVNYDTDLEKQVVEGTLTEGQAAELLAWADILRSKIAECRLRRIASTRLVFNAMRAMATGRTLADVKRRYFQDWSRDEMAKIGSAA